MMTLFWVYVAGGVVFTAYVYSKRGFEEMLERGVQLSYGLWNSDYILICLLLISMFFYPVFLLVSLRDWVADIVRGEK